MGLDYKSAGVDISKAEKFIEIIRGKLKPEEKRNIGLFGGLFDLSSLHYRRPVLVSSTDGVGTKLLIAKFANNYRTVGIDLVAMCVNDVVTTGAKPLFFLDYIAAGNLELEKGSQLIEGIIEGCRHAGCMLIGGETAEMPGMYQRGSYELAGFCVGIVEREKVIDGKQIEAGDVLVGVRSSGVHSSGLSLARKALGLDEQNSKDVLGHHTDDSLLTMLLTPTRIFVDLVLDIVYKIPVRGIAHITGGGIYDNVRRLLPEGRSIEIFWENVEPHPIFHRIQQAGNISEGEMRRTFNMGIGLVLIVDKDQKERLMSCLIQKNEEPVLLGEVV